MGNGVPEVFQTGNLLKGQDLRFQGLWRMDGTMGAVVGGGGTDGD